MDSEDLLKYIHSRPLSPCNSINTFDFSVLCITIPHSKLKGRFRELVQMCFNKKKNGQRRYRYLVLGRDRSYIVGKNTLILPKCSLELISSKCSVGIIMGTNCDPLLADLFLYSYEADFIQVSLKTNEKKLTVCYLNYIPSLNKSRFGDFVDRIYLINTRDTDRSASYLDLLLEIDC